jgi:uncharacterized protein YndB with AHSA1/START domain
MATASSGTTKLTLPTDTQIRLVREFDAPSRLVYKAWTDPALIMRWWTAGRGEPTVCEVDLRPGGAWRYAMVAGDGGEVAFHGEYTEVVPERRLVHTEFFEGAPGAPPAIVTVEFEERDGRTLVTQTMELPDRPTRDMVVATGMEDGVQDAMDLLERLAISLA